MNRLLNNDPSSLLLVICYLLLSIHILHKDILANFNADSLLLAPPMNPAA